MCVRTKLVASASITFGSMQIRIYYVKLSVEKHYRRQSERREQTLHREDVKIFIWEGIEPD